MRAAVASPDGSKRVDVVMEGDPERPTQLGVNVALELRTKAKSAGITL